MELYSELLGITDETARLSGRIPYEHSFVIAKIFKAYWNTLENPTEEQHHIFNRWATNQNEEGLILIPFLNVHPDIEEALIEGEIKPYEKYRMIINQNIPEPIAFDEQRRELISDGYYWVKLQSVHETDSESLRLGYYINPFKSAYILHNADHQPLVFIDYDEVNNEVWLVRGKVKDNKKHIENFFASRKCKLIDMVTLLMDPVWVKQLQDITGVVFPDIMTIPVIDDGIKLMPPEAHKRVA